MYVLFCAIYFLVVIGFSMIVSYIQAESISVVNDNIYSFPQHQDLPPLLQDDYHQSCDRIAQLESQLDEAKCKCELEKKRNATEKKKLQDQIKEVSKVVMCGG